MSGFTLALPGYQFHFPADAGSHPTYKTEWWYYTGHLMAEGKTFGFELTFFRQGLDPRPRTRASRWAASALYLAHFAITDVGAREFHYQERVDRGALGLAGAETDRENVWIEDWRAHVSPVRSSHPDLWPHHLEARSDFGAIQLLLTPQKPPVIQGQRGVSQKGPGVGQASHYYSYTRLAARGTIHIHGRDLPVRGTAWMDHEFGSDQLSPDETGWDWFSIQLEDGWDLMLYQLRQAASNPQTSRISPYSSGVAVTPNGQVTFLPRSQFTIVSHGLWTSPRTGDVYPSTWELHIPSMGIDLHAAPTIPDQELETSGSTGVTYWEGDMKISGQHAGHAVSGVGYTELTGYGKDLAQLK